MTNTSLNDFCGEKKKVSYMKFFFGNSIVLCFYFWQINSKIKTYQVVKINCIPIEHSSNLFICLQKKSKQYLRSKTALPLEFIHVQEVSVFLNIWNPSASFLYDKYGKDVNDLKTWISFFVLCINVLRTRFRVCEIFALKGHGLDCGQRSFFRF